MCGHEEESFAASRTIGPFIQAAQVDDFPGRVRNRVAYRFEVRDRQQIKAAFDATDGTGNNHDPNTPVIGPLLWNAMPRSIFPSN